MTDDTKNWLEQRMITHRENALAALRALSPEDVTTVLKASLPQRRDLSRKQIGDVLEILSPMHQEAWAKDIQEQFKDLHSRKPQTDAYSAK